MKTGRQSFRAERPVYVRSSYTIVGPKEGDGAFGALFDTVLSDDLWGERSYEKAESKMHREAVRGAMCLAGEERDGVDLMLAGDLLNELSASGFAMRYFKVPFAGLYNACSTFSEGMLIGTALISGGAADTVSCSTSSHFASAERQYRYPLELGNQRTPTSQWTVTGAGCTVLGARRPTAEEDARNRRDFAERMRNMREECLKREGEGDGKCDPFCKNGVFSGVARRIKAKLRPQTLQEPVADENYRRTHLIRISGGTFGKVVDFGIDDESNMGGAMAPAAADTLIAHFEDTGTSPSDYDAIFTGDLGRFGKEAFDHLLSREGVSLGDKHRDCGAEFYLPRQKTFQGGSGAGCVNTVFNAMIAKELEKGSMRRVLVLATGALLNKDTPLQKETIPAVSHAFVAESEPM